uniref:MRN complex-interacting protein N-terminal domain-containing protein n=1 Tax=Periophthalmus magnuspinnatus TaxID=409849 RepID=A0A3B4BBA7_9GOBI
SEMVQQFHVLRCFSCEVFQVQQVKKVNKWSCKLCGQKQSVLKEFGRGSGADCRRHVQKLNAARGAKMEDEEVEWSNVGNTFGFGESDAFICCLCVGRVWTRLLQRGSS